MISKGSERVGKTNSSGSVLTEAKYINTSLFFLEMVIVALYEKATKGRQHIPYRNSLMTSVLRWVFCLQAYIDWKFVYIYFTLIVAIRPINP